MKNKGFTLIELSIVIVIIGLIVAGVVGGQALVKQAKLRSVLSDSNAILVASNTFRLEYNSLPGDMSNAHDYWGANCDINPPDCNGNGDKRITDGSPSAWFSNELYRYWQHLNLAELYPGNYTGERGSPFYCEAGIVCPTGALPRSVYSIWWQEAIYTNDSTINVKNANYIYLGGEGPTNIFSNSGILTPKDMKAIDDKADDGIASTGVVLSEDAWNPNASNGLPQLTNCVDTAGDYILSSTDLHCDFFYLMQ